MASENLKNNSRLITFTVLLTAFFVTLISTFSSMSNIAESSIRKDLQTFADFVTSESAGMGKNGAFNYGAINIQGWGKDKHATVADMDIDLMRKDTPNASKWSFTTPQTLVQSSAADPYNRTFQLAGPINILENGQLKSVLSFAAPVTYGYRDGYQNTKRIVSHTLQLPGQLNVAPAGEMPGVHVGQFTISYDANPTVAVDILPDDHERQSSYEFHNVKVDPGTGDMVTVGIVTSHLNEEHGQDNKQHGKYTLGITDLVLNEGGKTIAPYSLAADIDYSGDQPPLPIPGLTAPFNGNSDITVNSLTLSTAAFTVKAQGTLVMANGDTLPSGVLNIDINDVNKMLSSELFPEWSRLPLMDLLKKITGGDITTPHVIFPLKREKNGPLFVGNITFDDAYNAVIAALQKPVPVPVTGPQTTAAPVTAVQAGQAAPVAPAPASPVTVAPTIAVPAGAPVSPAPAPAVPAPAPKPPAPAAPASQANH